MKQNELIVYNGFHKIIAFETEIKNERVTREQLLVKSAVAGIVIDEANRIGLVSQYRPVIQRQTKEIPAGVFDKEGLSVVGILVEELMEECEIPKEDIISISEKPIHQYFMMAGSGDATLSLYEIRVKRQEDKMVQDVDVDSVEWVDRETMQRYIEEGQIVDGKSLLAYYYWVTRELQMQVLKVKEKGK